MGSKDNAWTEDYKFFRSTIPRMTAVVDNLSEKAWVYFDYGPKNVAPLILIPGASGTADIFFKQFVSLCPKGYRLISVHYPAYWTHEEWSKGFDRFLDYLKLDKVHLFGTALGGYLAQCYVQFRPKRVLSLILNNSFCDTTTFNNAAPCLSAFPYMPEFMLKRLILSNFPQQQLEPQIALSVDFMVQQLESLKQADLASRLVLNCTIGALQPSDLPLEKDKITIIDCMDDVAIPEASREEVYKFYPEAKIAHLRSGGNFPFLSRPDEMNMYMQVHLRSQGCFGNTPPPSQNDTPTATPTTTTTTTTTTDEDEDLALDPKKKGKGVVKA